MMNRKVLGLLTLCLCLFFCVFALADSGIETDEEGGIWNWDAGTYTDPTGTVHQITPEGVAEDGESGGSSTGGSSNGQVIQPDGGMIVITPDQDSVQQNPDGSISVESGTIQIQDDQPTRAPLEGAEWQAVLNSMAARNGAETPTVWVDSATGESVAVEVAYMGVGRSMVILNGQKTLVNTVDLKWQTEASEDKLLAMVDAPKDGYAWLRREPNDEITNPKVEKVRTNTVLRVINAGKNWTLVDYYGMRGYIRSGSLEFFYNDHTDFVTGYLSINGKTKGKDTVKIRSMDKSRKILGEYKIGTPVTVFDVIDGWVELDGEGFHGMIQSKYVTMERDIASAD